MLLVMLFFVAIRRSRSRVSVLLPFFFFVLAFFGMRPVLLF